LHISHLILKILNGGAGSVAQAVEHLPSKYKALNSNPNASKKRKEKEIDWYL
jgi:hypothetical protein